ncbi:RrF2 family transcriptional regulator [Devosia alba]|uniref:RrF2 family transcriptional regulator n=1 Tax=Devosia alba TaxID=3152360 RepID=UPI00326454C0
MKLSRREEIAIGILVVCAGHGAEWTTTEAVAASIGVSRDQAAQIVHRLMQSGLIETVRGRQGGLRLRYSAEQITLGLAMDSIGEHRRQAPERGVQAPGDWLTAITRAAAERVRQTFESFTIADLAREKVREKLTCFDCSIRMGVVGRMHIAPGRTPAALLPHEQGAGP